MLTTDAVDRKFPCSAPSAVDNLIFRTREHKFLKEPPSTASRHAAKINIAAMVAVVWPLQYWLL
jgi:hypothetical protein